MKLAILIFLKPILPEQFKLFKLFFYFKFFNLSNIVNLENLANISRHNKPFDLNKKYSKKINQM